MSDSMSDSFTDHTLYLIDEDYRIAIGEEDEGRTLIRYEEFDKTKREWVVMGGYITWPTHDMEKLRRLLIDHKRMCEEEAKA